MVMLTRSLSINQRFYGFYRLVHFIFFTHLTGTTSTGLHMFKESVLKMQSFLTEWEVPQVCLPLAMFESNPGDPSIIYVYIYIYFFLTSLKRLICYAILSYA